MRLAALILLAVALVFPANLAQAEITGRPRIIDGDTIEIQSQRIRPSSVGSTVGALFNALPEMLGALDGPTPGRRRQAPSP